jgi:DNA polymerase I-like protein with 3'-5' exonuclease and polymerase domains
MLEGWEIDVINQVPFSKKKGLSDSNLYIVNTKNEWDAFFSLLMTKKIVACDTETTGFNYYDKDRIIGMSFGWGKEHFYIPVRHVASFTDGEQPTQLNMDMLRSDLQKFFDRKDVFTIWHNCKFDFHFYKADNINVNTVFHDTMILWHLFDENAPKGLKIVSSGWTDVMKQKHKGLFGPAAGALEKQISDWRAKEAKSRRNHYTHLVMARADELKLHHAHQNKSRVVLKNWIIKNELSDHPDRKVSKEEIHYGYVPISLMVEYAATDTFLTYSLYEKMMKELDLTQDLIKVYKNELKLCRTLFDIEEKGVLCDKDYLKSLEKEFREECDTIANGIKKDIGDLRINLKSTSSLIKVLENRGAKFTKRTNTGKVALTKSVLYSIRDDYPIVEDILFLRAKEKLLNTYVLGIQEKLVNDDYIHMSFSQNVDTGRMSCSNPNMQNIGDNRIKRAFICPEDYYFIFADYSQVEVRLAAHFSEDPILLDAYSKNQDIHTRTASEVFDIPYDEMTAVLRDQLHENYKVFSDYRFQSKKVVFGVLYGVGASGLSVQIPRPEKYLDVPDSVWVDSCQDLIDRYFDRYRGLKRFINKCKRTVNKDAQIVNPFGRIRHLPEIKAPQILGKEFNWMRARAERQAANFLIQSTAADVFKTAVVRLHEEVFKGTRSRMVNLIHDDCQSYIHKDELYLLNKKRHVMEDFDFLVPLKVDFAFSTTSWADKKSLK